MTPEDRIAELEALVRKARKYVAADCVGPMVDCFCDQCNAARLLVEIDQKVPPL